MDYGKFKEVILWLRAYLKDRMSCPSSIRSSFRHSFAAHAARLSLIHHYTTRLGLAIAFDSGFYAGCLPEAVSLCTSLFSPSSISTWANPPGYGQKIDSQKDNLHWNNVSLRSSITGGSSKPVLETQILGYPEYSELGSYSGKNETAKSTVIIWQGVGQWNPGCKRKFVQ